MSSRCCSCPFAGLRLISVRDAEAAGSNPAFPTKSLQVRPPTRRDPLRRPNRAGSRPMVTFSARTASPLPPSRTPAGSRASSRQASIAPRTRSARGPRTWDALRTRSHRSTQAPSTPVGASHPPRTVRRPTPACRPSPPAAATLIPSFRTSPGQEKGIGLVEVLGRVTMQVFARRDRAMVAAPVQCDVDGVPKRPHCVIGCGRGVRAAAAA